MLQRKNIFYKKKCLHLKKMQTIKKQKIKLKKYE